MGGLGAASSAALGDPRIGVRVRIFGESDRDAVSLHVGAQLYFNAGLFGVSPHSSNVTDDGFRGRVNATLAGREGPVRWSFSLGAHLRQNTVTVLDTTIGNDLYATAGVAYVALDDRLSIGPELWASTVLDNAFEGKHNNVEGTLGAHYLIADTILVGAGIGPGFTCGAGTPDWRALARRLRPVGARRRRRRRRDTDSDGVLDPDDVCPTTPQGAHPDPARLGCPLMDTDQRRRLRQRRPVRDRAHGRQPRPDPPRLPAPRPRRRHRLRRRGPVRRRPAGPQPRRAAPRLPRRRRRPRRRAQRADQCRTVPQGPQPDPTRPGCPLPDRDRDTVPDNADHCPDEPGVPSTDPQRNGCPNRFVVVDGTVIRLLRPVFFATNRDVILPVSAPVLTAVGDVLRASGWIRRIRIEGHTDDSNTDEYNLDLSQRRANNVMRWLVQNGIAAEPPRGPRLR